MKRTLILPAVLLVILIQHSVRADRAIYVNLTGDGPTALSDVFEKDLVTGRTRVIIAHDAVPKSFQTRIERVTPSPGGAYLLIRASGAYDLVYKDGKRERQYGSEFMVPEGAKTRRIAPSYWVWSFTARKMTQVTDAIWSDDVFWAPDGRHLLVVNRPEYVNRPERLVKPRLLRSYDPATGTTSVRLKLPDRGEPIWSADNGGFQLRESGDGDWTKVTYIDLKGKSRVLPTRTTKWGAADASSPGRPIPYYAGGFVYLAAGKSVTRLTVGPMPGSSTYAPGTDFLFDKTGKRLAVLWSCVYGEPHINLDERLWIVDVESGKTRLHAHWEQGGGYGTQRRILAWVPDNNALIVREGSGAGDSHALKKYIITEWGVDVETLLPGQKGSICIAYLPD